jgi:hypothetical protein
VRKFKKKKKNFVQKLQFTYHKASLKDVKAVGEAFSPQKRTSRTSKNEIFDIFLFSIIQNVGGFPKYRRQT